LKSIGPLYVGKLRYWHKKALPVLEVGKTQETDMPYRTGRCLVFRFPFTTPGYYIGIFSKTSNDPSLLTDEDIDLIMMNAMRGRKAWQPEDGAYDDTFIAQKDRR
jgi:hypothetical protein